MNADDSSGTSLCVSHLLQLSTLALLVALCVSSCKMSLKPLGLPPPTEVTTIGPGDVFEMEIVREDDRPRTYTVAPDGTVDVPYVEGLEVAGLQQHEIAALVRKELKNRRILLRPKVLVRIVEFRSKLVVVSGEVEKDAALPFRVGMTLVSAISQAGGLTALAKKKILVTRKTTNGEMTDWVNYDSIVNGLVPDPLLQAGDKIHIGQIPY